MTRHNAVKSIRIMSSETALDETVRWFHKWGLGVDAIAQKDGTYRLIVSESNTNFAIARTGQWVIYTPSTGELRVVSDEDFTNRGLTNPHAGK